MDLKELRVNSKRLQGSLEEMAKIGATPRGGVQRLTLSDEDKQARDLFVQWLEELNLEISIDEMEKLAPELIVISPGPGIPQQAGISNDVVRHFGKLLPILGVCLGHQCIGYSFGGRVEGAGDGRAR